MKTRRPQLWKLHDFRLLTVSQLMSSLGQSIGRFALPLLVLFATNSATLAGIVGGLALGGQVIAGLLAGALVDRWNRRSVMLASSATRLVMWTSVGIAAAMGAVDIWHVGIVSFATGVTSAFSAPAERAALPQVVPEEMLPHALAVAQGRSAVSSIGGAPLGGALYLISKFAPFFAAALGMILAFVTALFLRTRLNAEPQERPQTIREGIGEGINFAFRNASIRAILIACAVVNVANTMYTYGLPMVLVSAGADSFVIGLVQMAGAVGLLAGSALAPFVNERFRVGTTAIVLFGLFSASYFLAAVLSSSAVGLGVLTLASFVLIPTMNVGIDTYILRVTPRRLIGRVTSVSEVASYVLMPLAPIGMGVLVDVFGPMVGLLACAVVALVAFLVLVACRPIWAIPLLKDLNDVAADRQGSELGRS